MKAEEIDYLFGIDANGVKTHESGNALANNILEWLDTPIGSVWGKPSWGHALNQYRHLPHSNTTAAAIENSIMLKIPRDLPSIPISRIRVEPVDVDIYRIAIQIAYYSDPIVRDMKL